MPETILKTPLHENHVRCGGRMVPFAGYEMPVQYVGIIVESKAVRQGAGMFDVSHMARLRLTGERVIEYLEWITSNDISKLADGTGQYSLLPNDKGGCVDDIIVYRISSTEFRMVVNAANHEKDVAWMRQQNRVGVTIEDHTTETVMIAVQGPAASKLLQGICDRSDALGAADAFGVVEASFGGIACFAARSGYTGEDGFELICKAEDGPMLFEKLLAIGITPCGLGSRDVLRVEAGLPLYGHELSDDRSPMSAGLGWVISKTKSFIGSEFIQADRANGTKDKLQGILLGSKRLPQPGMGVFVGDRRVGEVSSGVFSPVLDCGIAFAFIDAAISLETDCSLDIRGHMEPGRIVSKRFYKPQK